MKIRMAKKPSIYLDTGILSTLHYRGGSALGIAWQIRTREWWDLERKFFRLFSSIQTEIELEQGTFRAQKAALAEVRRLTFVPNNSKVELLIDTYMKAGIVPLSKRGDAVQLAYATAHAMDYLLTWNLAHLANVEVQRRLDKLNGQVDCRSPMLVSRTRYHGDRWDKFERLLT